MEWMFMPLRRYADFSGRSRRMEYWMWFLFQVLLGIGFWILMFIFGGAALMSGDPNAAMAVGGLAMIIWMIYGLVSLAFIIPNIAVTVRRLHDTNRSGWWILAPAVPYAIALFSMMGAVAGGDQTSMAAGGIIGMISILAALVLGLTLLVFMFLEGTRGPNQYGPDPKGADTGQVFA